MAIVNTGLLTKGLRSEFFERLGAEKTVWQDLCTLIPSNANVETYKWLGRFPQMRQMVDGRKAVGLRTDSYTVENLKYEATIEVDRDELADDQTGQIRQRVSDLAKQAATHNDYLLGLLLENGGAAGYTSYDGVSFFNDAHVSGNSGSQDNDIVFDISDHETGGTADDPKHDTMKGAIQAAIAAMMAFKDDNGNPLNIMPDGMVVVVPPNMYWAASEAVSAAIINNTQNVLAGQARVISMSWLTTTTRFVVLKTNGSGVRPFILQQREPLEFVALDQPDSETMFLRDKVLYGVRERKRLTYGMWQYAVRVTLAA